MSDTFPFSKKGERKITEFVGQELLYDYVTSKLDPERAAAVEHYIKTSSEAQIEINRITNGLNYAEHLAETRVSDSLIEEIKAPSSYFQVLLRKSRFDDWSPGIKMGIEVLVVAVGVISISLMVPWHRLMEINWTSSKEVVLAEVEKKPIGSKDEDGSAAPAVATKAEDTTQVFADETGDKAKPSPPPKAEIPAIHPPTEAPKLVQVVAPKPVSVPAPAVPLAAQPAPAVAPIATDTAGSERTGVLFRGNILVTNVTATAPKFVEKIAELGGRKAGEVELGWKKGSSRYFHFTMPESKYQALLDFAKDYGALKLVQEKHDRVMPKGIVRVIFTVDESPQP